MESKSSKPRFSKREPIVFILIAFIIFSIDIGWRHWKEASGREELTNGEIVGVDYVNRSFVLSREGEMKEFHVEGDMPVAVGQVFITYTRGGWLSTFTDAEPRVIKLITVRRYMEK